MSIEDIREAVVRLPRTSSGKLCKIPESLRAEILSQAERSVESKQDFARSVGLSASVVALWRKGSRAKASKLRAVRVVEEPPPIRTAGFTVEGPKGIRVSGMTVADVAELFGRWEGR
jgi:hypothetical protein